MENSGRFKTESWAKCLRLPQDSWEGSVPLLLYLLFPPSWNLGEIPSFAFFLKMGKEKTKDKSPRGQRGKGEEEPQSGHPEAKERKLVVKGHHQCSQRKSFLEIGNHPHLDSSPLKWCNVMWLGLCLVLFSKYLRTLGRMLACH